MVALLCAVKCLSTYWMDSDVLPTLRARERGSVEKEGEKAHTRRARQRARGTRGYLTAPNTTICARGPQ